jgi:ElaB/YqjD/DUF883 family membrane-anchored ribosome-binding protein
MDDTLATDASGETPAKERFAKAVEEAKAGAQALGKEARASAQALGKEAQERADLYREKLTSTGGEWSAQAKEKAMGYAYEGKAKASEAISGLGKLVSDNAGLIDDKVGPKYGNYARSAAQSLQEVSSRLEEKSLDDLATEAKEFVRQSPGLAVGIAAVGGFLLARLFRGSSD